MFALFGIATMMFMSGVLPISGPDAYQSNIWRVIYGLNFIPCFISLLGWCFFVKHDSLKFYLDKKAFEQAHNLIRKIYIGDSASILGELVHEATEFNANKEEISLAMSMKKPGYW